MMTMMMKIVIGRGWLVSWMAMMRAMDSRTSMMPMMIMMNYQGLKYLTMLMMVQVMTHVNRLGQPIAMKNTTKNMRMMMMMHRLRVQPPWLLLRLPW